jgi:medium-chain acyl-[acyl-carrier-protein] hydrolase
MRDAEVAFVRHADYVASFVEAVLGLVDLPLVLFGHSMGAVMAFEVARAMRMHSLCRPLYLFVSGMRAPHLPRVRRATHDLSEVELVDYLCKLGGVPAQLLEDAELRGMILPVVRRDFELMDFYRHDPEAPLDVPIRAYGGERDTLLDEAGLDAWREHTSAFQGTRTFAGGHMYLTTAAKSLLRDIADCLRPLTRRGNLDTKAPT